MPEAQGVFEEQRVCEFVCVLPHFFPVRVPQRVCLRISVWRRGDKEKR